MAARVPKKRGRADLHPLTRPMLIEMIRARGSHRAQVIIAGVYIDALLQQMLERAFIEDPCVSSFFVGQAPLSSFHWKIELAFALGLIPADLRRDLQRLRKLRNHFGHQLVGGSLSDNPAKQFLDDTAIYRFVRGPWNGKQEPMGPEKAFHGTMAVVAGFLEALLNQVTHAKPMRGRPLPEGADVDDGLTARTRTRPKRGRPAPQPRRAR